MDAAGNVYVADTGNNLVRKITPEGVVSTLPDLAETNHAAGNPAGSLPPKSPGGVAVDDAGNVYVADTLNHCVRKISPYLSPPKTR